MLKGLGAGGVTGALMWGGAAAAEGTDGNDAAVQDLLSAAVAWRETAAERDMLYRQAFNLARDRLDGVLRGDGQQRRGRRPLAFICDVDDTVLSSDTYWARLVAAGKQAFDDEVW